MSNVLKKILVVDDTPVNVKILVDLLTLKGYETLTAASGAEALAARVKVVVASFMQPAFEYRYQSNAS